MSSPPPPDPYAALGVPSDASSTLIKSTYRKLVLKCHPDKVADESLKAEKADEFHRIQQAYEILCDEESRRRYDAQVRLAQLRREALERRGSAARPAAYDDRAGATAPRAYEERRPSHAYDDDEVGEGYYAASRASARKSEGYEAASKRSPPRSSRTGDRAARSERRKTRERDTRREREGKYASVGEYDSDERLRHEEAYRRRDEEARVKDKYVTDSSRHASRSDDDLLNLREQKIHSQSSHARDYIEHSKVHATGDPRPHVGRSSHSQMHEVRRSSDTRPSTVRRSSARPRESGHESSQHRSSGRERRTVPEIVEPAASDRRERGSKSASSSPVEVKSPLRTTIRRAQTMGPEHDYRQEPPAHPTMRRAESMPINVEIPPASSRRRESHPVQSSKLRHAESAMHDSGYSSPGTPDVAQGTSPPRHAGSSIKYYYSSSGGAAAGADRPVPVAEDAGYGYANGHRTVVHEPSPTRERGRERADASSASTPRAVPPVSAASASAAAAGASRYTSTTYTYPSEPVTSPASPSRPPLPHSATTRASPHLGRAERERERKTLFCEIPHPPAGAPFRAEDVNWGKRYGPDDVTYASGYSRRPEREAHRPSIPRHTTYAY